MGSQYIPKIIHQAMLFNDLTFELIDNIKKIKALNPNWEYRFYDANDAENFIRTNYCKKILDTYNSINPNYGAAKYDLFRYLVMYKVGGVMLDIKSTMNSPLDQVLQTNDKYLLSQWPNRLGEDYQGWGFWDILKHVPGGEINLWYIISVPQNPLIKATIERVLSNLENYTPKKYGVGLYGTLLTTGPIVYTLAINPLLKHHPHRFVDFKRDLDFQVSIFPGVHDHEKLYKTHYRNLKEPIVIHSKPNLKSVKQSDIWSIGIYEGTDPFKVADIKGVSNPILTSKEVTDVNARFVADPFLIRHDKKLYLFFEVLNDEKNRGEIGYAESTDGREWKYKKIILRESFHLSYPYVFKHQNQYYLIPESYQDLSVRLYQAKSFPEQWEYMGNILKGDHFVDPSIFFYNGKWWLFAATTSNDVLNLFYSEELLGEWKAHPMNPIVKNNKHIARPGGRVTLINNELYRFAQDDFPYYGIQIFVFKIIELTETTYKEKIVDNHPIVSKTGNGGWNGKGMHHIDLMEFENKWIAAVDGLKQEFFYKFCFKTSSIWHKIRKLLCSFK